MGKLITADDVEIIFEKQNPDHACEWCIYVKVRKNDKEQKIALLTNAPICSKTKVFLKTKKISILYL